jgi:WD40 repeat protein
MIPEHRLATLLTSFQTDQILNCRYHNTTITPSLYTDHECPADDFPLQSLIELRNHSDEVWFLEFSHDGSMLATAGRDGLVCIYDTVRWKVRHEFREHDGHPERYERERERATQRGSIGVVYIAFSPDDQYLISCSQANEFVVVSTRDGRRVAVADHFDYPVTTAAWLPDSQHFVIGTQGSRRPLGLYSLRPPNGGTSSSAVMRNNEIFSWREPPFDPTLKEQSNSFRITDCAVSRDGSRLVAATLTNKIMLYDLRSRDKIAEWQMEDNITSINFSADGEEMLVSMMAGKLLLLDCGSEGEGGEAVVKMRFEGVMQKEFVVRSAFGGAGENFVISGSEGMFGIPLLKWLILGFGTNGACADSRVLIWRRETGAQVACLEGHGPGTVNAVAWHPTNPAMFASAGDDRRVRM